jgi:hypothetical protein
LSARPQTAPLHYALLQPAIQPFSRGRFSLLTFSLKTAGNELDINWIPGIKPKKEKQR